MSQRRHQLGDLQLAIMRVLWARGEATVRQVHAALQERRPLAPTTVATMLTKMEDKGIVAHHVDGRRYVYRALASELQVRRSMVGRLTERLFAGNAVAMVSHLLSEKEISGHDLETLRRLIEKYESDEESSR